MKVGEKHICPHCGSSSTTSLGHGGYKQGSNGFGDKTTLVAYQCNDYNNTFKE